MQVVKQSPWHRYRPWIITVLVVALFAWAFSGIPMSSVKPQALLITKAIFTGLFHPDWSYVYTGDGEDLITALVETLAIAFLGTFISAILSVPFAFLAARTKKGFFTPRSTLGGVGIMQVVKQSPWHRYRPWIITVLVVACFRGTLFQFSVSFARLPLLLLSWSSLSLLSLSHFSYVCTGHNAS